MESPDSPEKTLTAATRPCRDPGVTSGLGSLLMMGYNRVIMGLFESYMILANPRVPQTSQA